MATANAAQIEPSILEIVYKALTKTYEERAPLTKRVPMAPDNIRINSRGVRFMLNVFPNWSFGWFAEAGSYPVPGYETRIECKAYPTQNGSGFEFSGTWFRESKTPEAIAASLTEEMAIWQTSALKKMEQAFVSPNTGQIAVVAANYSGGNTTGLTMTTSFAGGSTRSNIRLWPNSRVQVFSTSGTQRVAGISSPFTITVSSRTVSTGATVFTGQVPTDTVATDLVVTEGSWNNAAMGLPDLVGNSGTVQGVARTSYPEALNADIEDAGGAPISVSRLEKHKNFLLFRLEQENVKLAIVWPPAQEEKMKAQGYGQIRYTDPGGTYRGEFKDVGFYDWEKIKSTDVEDTDIYGVYFDDFMKLEMKPFGPYDEDGMPWRLFYSNGTASDKFTGWFGWQGQYAAKRFNANFRIKNLDISGVGVSFLAFNN